MYLNLKLPHLDPKEIKIALETRGTRWESWIKIRTKNKEANNGKWISELSDGSKTTIMDWSFNVKLVWSCPNRTLQHCTVNNSSIDYTTQCRSMYCSSLNNRRTNCNLKVRLKEIGKWKNSMMLCNIDHNIHNA